MGDAKSLLGGTLLVTSLLGADGQVYAVAQGTVQTGSVSRRRAPRAPRSRGACPPPAASPAGASVERETGFQLAAMSRAAADPAQSRLHHRPAHRRGDQPGLSGHGLRRQPHHRHPAPAAPAGHGRLHQPRSRTCPSSRRQPRQGGHRRGHRRHRHGRRGARLHRRHRPGQPDHLRPGEARRSASRSRSRRGETVVVPAQRRRGRGGDAAARCCIVGGGASLSTLVNGLNALGVTPARHDLHPAGHQGRGRPAGRNRGDVMTAHGPFRRPAAPRPLTDGLVRRRRRPHRARRPRTSRPPSWPRCCSRCSRACRPTAPFGGGQAEETWRGFMIDAMAKQISQGRRHRPGRPGHGRDDPHAVRTAIVPSEGDAA